MLYNYNEQIMKELEEYSLSLINFLIKDKSSLKNSDFFQDISKSKENILTKQKCFNYKERIEAVKDFYLLLCYIHAIYDDNCIDSESYNKLLQAKKRYESAFDIS